MSNDQTPTPASLADTTVLPRAEAPLFPVPEGWRLLRAMEIHVKGDVGQSKDSLEWAPKSTSVEGLLVLPWDMNWYFRRIDPAPHTAPKCGTCGDSRLVDSGGQNPDGRWINRECPDCVQSGPVYPVGAAPVPAPKAPDGTSPAPDKPLKSMEPIIAAFEKVRHLIPVADIKVAKQAFALGFVAREEQVSTLTDALSRAREALAHWTKPTANLSMFDAMKVLNDLSIILESPALAKGVTRG